MTDKDIYVLAKKFRRAIENARDNHMFKNDLTFDDFPNWCCRDASLLLAEYLRHYDINTIYVWGTDDTGQTHGWLVLKDERVNGPTVHNVNLPNSIIDILKGYSNNRFDAPIENIYYDEEDILEGMIIDITAEQFDDVPIYMGYMDEVHARFSFESANDYHRLGDYRLNELYRIIISYLH